MYCTACGTRHADGAQRCAQCGASQPSLAGGPWPETIRNYLAEAILVTLCCCQPFGIPAIVFAAQVSGKLQAGDVEGAMKCSRLARLWCWLGFGTGLAIGLLYGIGIFFSVLNAR